MTRPGIEPRSPKQWANTLSILNFNLDTSFSFHHSSLYLFFSYSYLPNPSARTGYDTWSIFKRSLSGLNSEFSFSKTSCLTKAEEHSLPYYLPIAGGRIIGSIPFPRVLVPCEMQSVSSKIWTRVAASISYDDKHFTPGTFSYWQIWHKVLMPKVLPLITIYCTTKTQHQKLWPKGKFAKFF